MKQRSSRNPRSSSRGLTLGPKWGAKINAVEGIKLTPAAEKRAADFERRALSPAERRKEILRAYRQE
jgi:hypothetical protein